MCENPYEWLPKSSTGKMDEQSDFLENHIKCDKVGMKHMPEEKRITGLEYV